MVDILSVEDDVVIDFIFGMLEEERSVSRPSGKKSCAPLVMARILTDTVMVYSPILARSNSISPASSRRRRRRSANSYGTCS